MARAVGLPSRVAVGFSTGEEVEPGVYQVMGSHAHAWPEVYLGEFGWVPFEPTPGRGIPGAQSYTGVPEAQAAADDPSTATTRPSGVDDPFGGEVPDATLPIDETDGALSGGPDDGGSGGVGGFLNKAFKVVLLVLAAALLLVILLFLGVAASRLVRRHRRRRKATRAADQVRVAWEESVEAAELLGVIPHAWETAPEYARRAKTSVDGDGFHDLARLVGEAEFSAEGVGTAEAEEARRLADHLVAEARGHAGREERLRELFDPRPPEQWPSMRKGRRVDQEAPEPVPVGAPRVTVLEDR
jgi:hypothetical protein